MPPAAVATRSLAERYLAEFPASRKLFEQARTVFPADGAPVPGVLPAVQGDTSIVPPNDPDAVERALATDAQIGCVILEPTGGHFGAVPVRGDFLRALRELTARHGRLLIFDEVISG